MREIPFGRPMIGEEEKNTVMTVLQGHEFVHGPLLKDFESAFSKYINAPYAIAVSSCTAALHLTYFYLGITQNDEVIVPAQTHTATAHAVELCGGKAVFVDSEIRTGNIDIDQIEAKITEHTRAISVVPFLGMPLNMDRVNEIAQRHNLFVVEDAALAVGTYYKGIHAGLHGDVGCFSFYPVKHITTAEGGMLITKDEKIASQIQRTRAFGIDRHIGERNRPMYDVTMLGFNYRMNELQAAIGIEQVKKLDDILRKRKSNYHSLSEGLRSIDEIQQFESSHDEYQSSYYCLVIILNDKLALHRHELISLLKEKGVGTSIYYPKPVPLLAYYQQKYGHQDNEFPIASLISDQSVALPVGPHLDEEDMSYIVVSLKDSIAAIGGI